MNSKQYEIDMTHGPIFVKLIQFAVPLMLSSMLQLLFNAVDVIVVGRFVGSQALAAVSSNTSLINIFTTLFIGISLGVNVVVAQHFAVNDEKNVSETVHTAILSAIISGFAIGILGICIGRKLLIIMGVPDDVIELSALYLKIYFIGMPFFMVYNFGAAVLKAIGDTKRPLLFLLIAGIINAVFNVYLVVRWNLGVAGVAISTITSQFISCVLVVITLLKSDASYRLIPKRLRINVQILKKILSIGVPAGLQSMVVNIANATIQSNINSFGSLAMAGYGVYMNVNGFIYVTVNAVTQTAMTFVGQNYGIKDLKRVDKICAQCVLLSFIGGEIVGGIIWFFGPAICGIYSKDAQVAEIALSIIPLMALPYGLCGIMDTLPGCMRGMGYSTVPMLIHLFGVVIFRYIWMGTAFKISHTLEVLILSFPISWVITSILQFIAFMIVRKKVRKKLSIETA
ncbi:MAG: MATE family efflux transporter [Lachnospiraceae bacterium]|nr:MATE family efflux transporter [Lachnospiraceae bacterium]